MSDPIRIITWFWIQDPPRAGFAVGHVNRWAAMLRANLTIPYKLVCVTDLPEGMDPDIEIIPMSQVVPEFLMKMQGPGWSEKKELPQCYRRFLLLHPKAAEIFCGERLISMDHDCIALANLDKEFSCEDDLRILQGTSQLRPYNGGLIAMRAGARPQVYETITQEGIDESRKKFVGSDQAWISHVLGWGEQKFGPRHGIYAWTPRFVSMYSRRGAFMLPGDSKLIFYPANPKPWDLEKTYPELYATWAGTAANPLDVFKAPPARSLGVRPRLRLWAYDDSKGWGKAFQEQAKKAGHRCWTFTNAQTVADREPCFVRLDQQGIQRDVSRGIVARLAERGIPTLPHAREALWYDDKVAQALVLGPWLPDTWIEGTREEAESRLEYLSIARAFPIISKSAEGAGSANVKVLANEDEAWAEIVTAFGTGVPLKYGRIQKGYVYWQRLVPDNPHDYRVVVVGNYAYGLVRLNKPGTVFASGSGQNYPITLATDRENRAMQLGVEIAKVLETQWMAFDFVFNDEQAKVLEMSSAWTMKSYEKCQLFNRETLVPAVGTGADSFKIAVDILTSAARRKLEAVA